MFKNLSKSIGPLRVPAERSRVEKRADRDDGRGALARQGLWGRFGYLFKPKDETTPIFSQPLLPRVALRNFILIWVGIGVAFLPLVMAYSTRDALLLAGIILAWLALGIAAKWLGKSVLWAVPVSFLIYETYVLDISRHITNIGVVWFLVIPGWVALSGRKGAILIWSAISIAATVFIYYRSLDQNLIWQHPLSLANLIGVNLSITLTCYVFQWIRQYRETQFTQMLAERDELSQQLAKANVSLREAEMSKSRLLATMSHELRTPMMTIVAAADDLRNTPQEPMQQAIVNTLQRSADNIADLMNDVLELETMTSGNATLARECFDVLELAKGACELTKTRPGGARILLHVAPDLPRALNGDASRIRQVLINLINNAIHHADANLITVVIDRFAQGTLQIVITDDGKGIAKDKLASIFDPYVQLADKAVGNGLGLSIVRAMVEALGGHITVASRLRAGTRFRLTLPLEDAKGGRVGDGFTAADMPYVDAEGAPSKFRQTAHAWNSFWAFPANHTLNVSWSDLLEKQQKSVISVLDFTRDDMMKDEQVVSAAPSPASHGPTLIVVEDDLMLCSLLERFFRKNGYEVFTAHDAREAKHLLTSVPTDIALLDMNIPGDLEGRDLIRLAATQSPRPVICTLSGLPAYEKEALAAGADAFVSKPVKMQNLKTQLETLRARRKAETLLAI